MVILFSSWTGILTIYKRRLDDLKDPFDKKIAKERQKQRKALLFKQFELLSFAAVIAGISLLALVSDIIKVTFNVPLIEIPPMTFSGKTLLFNSAFLDTAGERLIAFFIFALFFTTSIFVLLTLVAFLSRSEFFEKFAVSSLVTSASSCLMVGLFGQYYRIIQALNEDIILNLLAKFQIDASDILEYKITSQSLIYFYIVLAILVFLFIRRPLTKIKNLTRQLYANSTTIFASSPNVHVAEGTGSNAKIADTPTSTATPNTDPCPTFTAMDGKGAEYMRALAERKDRLIEDPSLPGLVSFIVQYARDSRLHLIYEPETVATFLAGLGMSRLSILQGMSGTGKTSLPKIFTEALSSICDIVEVESSWRDKNELLGYYNEFSKMYTPKKFTQALYRARLNPEIITFIVLDEMNLSRIEYYFSDFLSLMEHEPDRRMIQLLNVPICRHKNGELIEYKGLDDGISLKVPQNVWFIGTANRDESTYDISDKVYDRAHTMNFDKRATKPSEFGSPIPARYLPASELIRLFEEAKASFRFDPDKDPTIAKVEELLKPYNISFGNRIAVQMETFISIYAACFMPSEEVIHTALDTILLSKVVKKLELKSVEDKESLAEEFKALKLRKCHDFILSLKED